MSQFTTVSQKFSTILINTRRKLNKFVYIQVRMLKTFVSSLKLLLLYENIMKEVFHKINQLRNVKEKTEKS